MEKARYECDMAPSRIFLCILLSFMFGVAARSFFSVPLPLLFIFFLVAAVIFIYGVIHRHGRAVLIALIIIAGALGIFRYASVVSSAPDLSSYYGKMVNISGVIALEPESDGTMQRITLGVKSLDGKKTSRGFGVFVTARNFPQYDIGDLLEAQGRLDDPHESRITGYADRLESKDIFALMYFPRLEKTGSGEISWLRLALARTKETFEEKINIVLPEPQAAFLKGLLLGERRDLPQSLRDDFATTGTTHIVALSGYNITLVGGFFMSALLFLTVPFTFAFWLAVFAITLFVLLTGASPSVVRAGMMGILLLIARKEGRLYHMGNALALAGAVMLWFNPLLLRFDAAFELSFLATIGLVYLSPRVERIYERSGERIKNVLKRTRYHKMFPLARQRDKNAELFSFRNIFIETTSAQICVAPLLIFLFGRLSLISPITNLLILIAVPYAMAVGFVAACAAFFSSALGRVIGWGAWILLEYMMQVIRWFALVPFASVHLDSPPVLIVLAVMALILAIFFVPRLLRSKISFHSNED